MRYVWLCGVIWSLSFAAAYGKSSHPSPSVPGLTIVLTFDGPRSELSLDEMKRELGNILKDSGVQLNWRGLDEAAGQMYEDLVVVKFRGRCEMLPDTSRPEGPARLAWTHVDGSHVLPFSEVQCDRVRSCIRGAMWPRDFRRADLLFGRALGRVLAHELYHMIVQTVDHDGSGIAQTALTGRQLISDSLELSPATLEQMLHNLPAGEEDADDEDSLEQPTS